MILSWGRALSAAVLSGLFAANPVLAAESGGNPAAGKAKFYTCEGCHGIPGYSNIYPTFHVPKLGGQHADYIVSALKAYRNNKRDHSTMHAQASSLSDQDIRDIAAYLSQDHSQ